MAASVVTWQAYAATCPSGLNMTGLSHADGG
jgi:hypothetical protein